MRFLLFFSVLALIFVNGWTDAPKAIAGVVATGSMPTVLPPGWLPPVIWQERCFSA